MLSRGAYVHLSVVALAAVVLIGACSSSRSTRSDSAAQAYVEQAAIGNMFEIRSSELAPTYASSADVKSFARMMVADHTKASADLEQAIDKSEIEVNVPGKLDPKHQALLDQLVASRGTAFDHLYTEMQTNAHREAYKLHQNYSESGQIPALRVVATSAVPMIEHHLMEVQRLPGS